MACQMEMVLGALVGSGYNLDYKNGTFKKYVGNGEIFVKVVVYLEEVHLMSATQIHKYLEEKEQQLFEKTLKEWLQ